MTDAKFKPEQAAFVTAFQRREHGAFKTVASLAWGSIAWCFQLDFAGLGIQNTMPAFRSVALTNSIWRP
jgi:hypothetical protein